MNPVTQKELGGVLTSLSKRLDDELFAKTKEQLEENWFFKFDATTNASQNVYNFHKMLDLYGGSCRRWEEHHNGTCCVVERVRDQYLWPKISRFVLDLQNFLESQKRTEL